MAQDLRTITLAPDRAINTPGIQSILTLYHQGLKLALPNLQNASENKKLRVQSASLSHFFASSKKSS